MTTTRRHIILSAVGAAALAGCSAVPERPVRATQYDFGPSAAARESAAAPPVTASRPPLVLGDVEATSALDASAVLYRLGYADPNQLRAYANARWSAPMPQLIRQRLRERLAQDRVVIDLTDSSVLARTGGVVPRLLRVQLEEFSQWFDTPAQSSGVLRLRATLTDNTTAGERVAGQRAVVARRPAPTPDAPGGVRALAAAADAAAEDIAQWLRQQP